MRFGIVLGGDGQSGQAATKVLADQVAKAREAYQQGFHSVWAGPGYLHGGWHAALLLARVSAEVPGMELGIIGLLPLLHPVELAEQLATLDTMCGGKLVLAAALGWREFQFRAFEIPPKQRLARFYDVLDVMGKLWTQARVTHHSDFFSLDDVPGTRQPLQQPRPKLLIAANLEAGIRRAARLADGWLISSRATLATLTNQIPLYRQALQTYGGTGSVAAWREMYVARDKPTAIAAIRPYVEWLYRDRAAQGHNRTLPESDRIDVDFDRVLEGRFIIGSPAECIAEVEKYATLGVEEIIVRCQWPGMDGELAVEALRLFGRDVMPQFV